MDQERTIAGWARNHGVDYPQLGGFRAYLGARATVPSADRRGEGLLARWYAMLFVHDDLHIDTPSADLTQLRRRVRDIERLLFDPRSTPNDPVAAMIADILHDVSAYSTTMSWFTQAFLGYLRAGVEELASRRKPACCPDEHLHARTDAGAISASIELAYLVTGVELDAGIRRSRGYARLLQAAARHICVTNDILSLPKELNAGDDSNLAIAMKIRHPQRSWSDIVHELSRTQVEAALDEFDRAVEQCSSSVSGLDAEPLRRAIDILEAWMGGHMAWEHASSRHGGAGLEA